MVLWSVPACTIDSFHRLALPSSEASVASPWRTALWFSGPGQKATPAIHFLPANHPLVGKAGNTDSSPLTMVPLGIF
jgi:hypothetical protein